jgi:hypothetical protein
MDHEHNAFPPPVPDLLDEGVQGLGSSNQQDLDVIEVIRSRCIPAPSCGSWLLAFVPRSMATLP